MDILFIRHGETDWNREMRIQGGESFAEVEARLRSFLAEAIIPLEGKAETVLVVAHGGILRTLTRIFDRRPLSAFWTADHQPNCCAHRIRCTNGQLSLEDRSLIFYDEDEFRP